MIPTALNRAFGAAIFCILMAVAAADARAQDEAGAWQGPYGGILVGILWSDVEMGMPTGSSSHSSTGVTAGLFSGWNFLIAEGVIAGLESDLTFGDFSGDVSLSRYQGSYVGRIGILVDPSFLIYALGGLSVIKSEAEVTIENTVLTLVFDDDNESQMTVASTMSQQANVSRRLWGYVIGGGIEAQFDDLGFFSRLGLEYRYANYDDWTFNVLGQSFSVEPETHELRFRFIVPLN